MNSLKRNGGLCWKSCYWVLVICIIWGPLIKANDDATTPNNVEESASDSPLRAGADPGSASANTSKEPSDDMMDKYPGLTRHYKRLHKFYSDKKDSIKTDCKVKSDGEMDDHSDWGTIETLAFLTENMEKGRLTDAEKMMKLPKLRFFLARVGYLKDPGSLIFLDRQTQTIRLTCPTGDGLSGPKWRQHGEPEVDNDFQDEGEIGKKFKDQAPSGLTYIHKYICFNIDADRTKSCSHTFYVITKMLPELPFGLLVREDLESDTKDQKGASFPCSVPYCRLEVCQTPGETGPVHQRSYPPFKISWNITITDNPFKIINKTNYNDTVKNEENYEILWNNKIRESKDAEFSQESSFKDVSDLTKRRNGFNEEVDLSSNEYATQSRIYFEEAHEHNHVGLYECIIEDANGVVTTPNVRKGDYRGQANVYVIPEELNFAYAVAGVAVLGVLVIIMICPKKMEHDDGTPYTKDELVSPAEHENTMAPTETPSKMAKDKPSRAGANAQKSKSKGNASTKSGKGE